ncbi:MAG TPA: hypothetical protein VHL11_05180 [Phototrophicaceae bacterium]|nr:hypothetical protein [Phototrophicaceae bacterium]
MKSNNLEFLALIWGALVILGGMSMIVIRESSVGLIIVLSIVAFLSTMAVTLAGNSHYEEKLAEKTKNSGGSSDSLMRLLDEDDLDELRSRVKRRLIDQIEGSGDGELSSLDALLADQQNKRR